MPARVSAGPAAGGVARVRTCPCKLSSPCPLAAVLWDALRKMGLRPGYDWLLGPAPQWGPPAEQVPGMQGAGPPGLGREQAEGLTREVGHVPNSQPPLNSRCPQAVAESPSEVVPPWSPSLGDACPVSVLLASARCPGLGGHAPWPGKLVTVPGRALWPRRPPPPSLVTRSFACPQGEAPVPWRPEEAHHRRLCEAEVSTD